MRRIEVQCHGGGHTGLQWRFNGGHSGLLGTIWTRYELSPHGQLYTGRYQKQKHCRDYIFDNNFYLNRFGGLDS